MILVRRNILGEMESRKNRRAIRAYRVGFGVHLAGRLRARDYDI